MWVAEAVATDGLPSPRKAVKITVMHEAEPNATYLAALVAQTTGQYRVQYQDWPPQTPTATKREM